MNDYDSRSFRVYNGGVLPREMNSGKSKCVTEAWRGEKEHINAYKDHRP